jgi:bacterioferritin
MRGNEKVIRLLNEALTDEFKAIVQYMVQAEMCDNWGYARLGGSIKKRAFDEMHHAEGLIERILFLEGMPKFDPMPTPQIDASVKAQLETDLACELAAVSQYNAAIATCVELGDNGTRTLFEKMLYDEEGHADFLDTQLAMIGELGLATYLSRQLSSEEKGK